MACFSGFSEYEMRRLVSVEHEFSVYRVAVGSALADVDASNVLFASAEADLTIVHYERFHFGAGQPRIFAAASMGSGGAALRRDRTAQLSHALRHRHVSGRRNRPPGL